MRKIIVGLICALAAGGGFLPGAEVKTGGPPSVRIWLTRTDEHKFLVPAMAPGGPVWLALDTGAPVTCADQTKNALFKFQSFGPGTQPPPLMMNGQQARMTLIPQMDFGGLAVKNVTAVLVDLSTMNPPHQGSRNRTAIGDGILGLDSLFRLHAVINCGSGKIFLHPNPASEGVPGGWRAVPMRLIAQHLVVPVSLNGFQTFFAVDTGSPSSIIDSALCSSQSIPVGDPNVPIKAIHHELKAALGTIAHLQIGSIDLGQTEVAVFDFNTLTGTNGALSLPMPFTGLIGAQTLESLKAIIDCNSMQLYIKQPGRGGWWAF